MGQTKTNLHKIDHELIKRCDFKNEQNKGFSIEVDFKRGAIRYGGKKIDF